MVRLVGVVRAKDKLILDSKSNLKGDIFTKNLVIEEGSKFDGKCKTGGLIDIGEIQETTKPSTTITK